MKLITDTAELGKFIDGIATRGKRLDTDIQIAGVSALARLKEFGDIGYCNRLYLALSKGARKSAMSSWLLTHGSLVANTGEDKATKPFIHSKDKTTDVEGAMADPWFDHKPDPKPDEVFDVQAALLALIKRAKGKQLENGELLAKVEAIIGEHMPAGDEGVPLPPSALVDESAE